MLETLQKYEIPSWIEANKHRFLPPVLKEYMYDEQLKVLWVVGPNQQYYHLEEGEELFYQWKGDIRLNVLLKNGFKDITIKEGQIFMLPGRVYHQPKRPDGTLGVIFERTRAPHEPDCIRYFVDGTQDLLWERWFYCENIPRDLGGAINQYDNSESKVTGKPGADSQLQTPAYLANRNVDLHEPFYLDDWLAEHEQEIKSKGKATMFDYPQYKTQVVVYGAGHHKITPLADGDIFIWQLAENSEIIQKGAENKSLGMKQCFLIPGGSKEFMVNAENSNSRLITIQMPMPK